MPKFSGIFDNPGYHNPIDTRGSSLTTGFALNCGLQNTIEQARRMSYAEQDAIEREGIGLASITVWEVLNGIGRLPRGSAPGKPCHAIPRTSRQSVRELDCRLVPS